MFVRIGDIFVNVWGCRAIAAIAVSIALVGVPTIGWPQQPQAQTPAVPSAPAAPATDQAPVPPEPPARSNPGLVEEIGKLLKSTTSSLTPTLLSPQQTIDGLNSSAKSATDSLARIAPLSGQSVAVGRTMCVVAANGAPDCKAASDQLCKQQGYKEGRSLDIEAAQKCSAKAYFSGASACKTENFVTRAVCQ